MTPGPVVPEIPEKGARTCSRPERRAPPDRAGPEAVIERWHRLLATLADNDNGNPKGRGRAVAAVLVLPLVAMTAVVACVRFLL